MCGSRGGSLEGTALWRGRETKSALRRLAVLGALALVPVALGGSLSGSVVLDPAPAVDLTSAGAIDWAIWGYAGGGTSTSPRAPTSQGGRHGDRRADEHRPGAERAAARDWPVPGRAVRVQFDWSNGRRPARRAASARGSSTTAGRRRHRSAPTSRPSAKGFSFDVPAGPALRTLRVYVATNRAAGTLTASSERRLRAGLRQYAAGGRRHSLGRLHAHLPRRRRAVRRCTSRGSRRPTTARRSAATTLRSTRPRFRPDRRQHDRRPRRRRLRPDGLHAARGDRRRE